MYNTVKKLTQISIVITIALLIGYVSLKTQHNNTIPLEVFFSSPERTNPKISPDGKHLAYCAPVNGVLNVWVQTLGQDDAHAVTAETKHGIFCYYWSPDSTQILYIQDNNGDENYHIYGVDLATNLVRDFTPFDGVKASILTINKDFQQTILLKMNKNSSAHFDVYELNLFSGELKLVAKNPGNIRAWLADRNFKVRAAVAVHNNGKQSLLVRDDEHSLFRMLIEFDFEDTIVDELYCGLCGFSNDGTKLYLNTSHESNTRSLISVDINTGERTILATDSVYDVSWVFINADTGEPEVIFWDKEQHVHQVLNSELRSDFARIYSISNGDLNYIQRSENGALWIVGFNHDNKSYEYYLYDRKNGKVTFLFNTRPMLNKYVLAPMKPISYVTRDGLTVYGYLTLPPGSRTKKFPLVLYVHGGPFARDVWGYEATVQWLANRGYACLQVNYRGSSGYGKDFLAAGNGEWGNKMHHDLVDAVQWAVDQNIADAKQVAIFGGSYGGYAALVGAAFTPDLFCCAIDYVGPCNLITLLKSIPPYWSIAQWEKRIGKLSDEEFLKSRSPLFKVDQIKIPIFVAHGAHDVRVTVAESKQLVDALKNKGLSHEYLVFEDEGHGFSRPENRIIFYTAVEKFLAQHLKS